MRKWKSSKKCVFHNIFMNITKHLKIVSPKRILPRVKYIFIQSKHSRSLIVCALLQESYGNAKYLYLGLDIRSFWADKNNIRCNREALLINK